MCKLNVSSGFQEYKNLLAQDGMMQPNSNVSLCFIFQYTGPWNVQNHLCILYNSELTSGCHP